MISRNPRLLTADEVQNHANEHLPKGYTLEQGYLFWAVRTGDGVLIARVFAPTGRVIYRDPLLKGRLDSFEAALKRAQATEAKS